MEVIEAETFKMTCLQSPTGACRRVAAPCTAGRPQLRTVSSSIKLCINLHPLVHAGTKFVLLTTPSHPHPDQVLRKVYETYADHLKDPFYTVEMPIRSETFDTKMAAVIRGA